MEIMTYEHVKKHSGDVIMTYSNYTEGILLHIYWLIASDRLRPM